MNEVDEAKKRIAISVLKWMDAFHESDEDRHHLALLLKIQTESYRLSSIRNEARSLVTDQEKGLIAESINDRIDEFRRLFRLDPIQPVIPKPLAAMLDDRDERIRELEARVDELLRRNNV